MAHASIFAGAAAGLLLFAAAVVPDATHASTVPGGWWSGSWKCNIDGRPARMKWHVADASEGSCDGDICSTSSAVRWAGSFSDNGSRSVPLSRASEGTKGGLYFTHADGNRWYLAKPVGGKAVGYTTWNGQRYPLSCWR